MGPRRPGEPAECVCLGWTWQLDGTVDPSMGRGDEGAKEKKVIRDNEMQLSFPSRRETGTPPSRPELAARDVWLDRERRPS